MKDATSAALPRDLKPQPRNLSETIHLLETAKWADDLSGRQVELLAGYLRVYTAEKGSVIVREGSHEVYLCLLVDGKVRVEKERSEERRVGKECRCGWWVEECR